MDNTESQTADILAKKADHILSKLLYWGDRNQDAVELYERAANMYRMDKQWVESALCFEKCAQCYDTMKECLLKSEACKSAALCYLRTKSHSETALNLMQEALKIHLERGAFDSAGRMAEQIAETIENELGNKKDSIAMYQKALDCYDAQNKVPLVIKMQTKMAHMYASIDEFNDALQLFETLGETDSLNKYRSKDYFMKAVLCQFAQLKPADFMDEELERIQKKLLYYLDTSLNFNGSFQHTLVLEILTSFQKRDIKVFTEAVTKCDRTQKFDDWMVQILVTVKKVLLAMEEGEMLGYDDFVDLT